MPLRGLAELGLRPPDHIPFRWTRERDNYARTACASGRFFFRPPGDRTCA
jgi:hypothetical protein